MGEQNPFYGIGSLYIQTPDGKTTKVENTVSIKGLVLDEDVEVRQEKPQWTITGSIEVNLTAIVDKKAPIARFFARMRKKAHDDRKAIFWAVTHGYSVCFEGKRADDESVDVQYWVYRPREARQLLRYCPFVPKFTVFDKEGFMCLVKNGKVL